MTNHDYRYIRAWGRLLRSFAYYINQQIEIAIKDNAPEDAIYKDQSGQWHRFSDLKPEVKERVKGQL